MTLSQAGLAAASQVLSQITCPPDYQLDPSITSGLDRHYQLTDLVCAAISSNVMMAPWDWVLGSILEALINHLGYFQSILTDLTGDSTGLSLVVTDNTRCQQLIDGLNRQLDHVRRHVGESWTGEAGDQCQSTLNLLADVLNSYPGAIHSLNQGFTSMARAVADTKDVVITIVVDMISHILQRAGALIATLGWCLGVPGGLAIIASATMAFISSMAGYIALHARTVCQTITAMIATCAEIAGQISGVGVSLDQAAYALVHQESAPVFDPSIAGSGPTTFSVPSSSDQDIARVVAALGRKQPLPPGWAHMSDAELRAIGIDPALLESPNGFSAGIFRHQGSGRIIVAFAGTDFSDLDGDVTEDLVGALTVSDQSRNVITLTEAIRSSELNRQLIVYAGHSLGGRLAAVAAAATGNPAVTYNAAGVSEPTMAYLAARAGISREELDEFVIQSVRRYTTDDDILTWIQQSTPGLHPLIPDAVGSQINLDGEAGYFGGGHSLSNVIEAMEP